jgi:hypothetical protein
VAKKSLFFVGAIGESRTEDEEEAALGEDRREGRPSSPRQRTRHTGEKKPYNAPPSTSKRELF